MPFASTCRKRRHAHGGLRRAAVLLAGALAAWPPGMHGQTTAESGPSRPQSPAAVFRAQTDLVVLQVAVVDQQHRFVGDLQLEDFGVYEEGRRQNVTVFVSTDAPLDVMVLLDTSSSMTGRMALAQDAAIRLIRTLKPGDRGAVVLFSSRVHVAQPLTGDLSALETAINDARPRGSTALYEALYITQRELSRTRQAGTEMRRQAIVVLTDGDDNGSHVSFDDVREESRSSAVTIFTIVPSPFPEQALQPMQTQRVAFQMRQLAEDTGGRAFAPATAADLQAVFADIGGELGQQYWLAYARPPGAPAGFRRVSVRVETRPGLRARTRIGFYASRSLEAAAARPSPAR